MTTPEGKLVAYIKKTVKDAGGEVRKCEWAGRSGAPDLFIMYKGHHFWVECKAPGMYPRPTQVREIEKMRTAGCEVFVIDRIVNFYLIWTAIVNDGVMPTNEQL